MADRGHHLAGVEKAPDDLNRLWLKAQLVGVDLTARQHERVVVGDVDHFEVLVHRRSCPNRSHSSRRSFRSSGATWGLRPRPLHQRPRASPAGRSISDCSKPSMAMMRILACLMSGMGLSSAWLIMRERMPQARRSTVLETLRRKAAYPSRGSVWCRIPPRS